MEMNNKKPASVALYCLGSLGDFLPLLGLASTLEQRGYKVFLIGSARFKAFARKEKVTFCTVSSEEDYDRSYLANSRALQKARRHLIDFHIPAIAKTYEALDRLNKTSNLDLLVALDEINGLTWFAETKNIPFVKISLTPHAYMNLQKSEARSRGFGVYLLFESFLLAKRILLTLTLTIPVLNPIRRSLKLAPFVFKYTPSISRRLELALFPKWFSSIPENAYSDIRFCGFPCVNFSIAKERNLFNNQLKNIPKSSIIAFVTGSATIDMETLMVKANEACSVLSMFGIFVNTSVKNVTNRNFDKLLAFEYIDFEYLFKYTGLVVHHGGIGTISQAIKAGLPQIIMPLVFDQKSNGLRIQSLRLGDMIPEKCTSSELAACIRKVLSNEEIQSRINSYQKAVENVDSLNECADQIESFIVQNKFSYVQ